MSTPSEQAVAEVDYSTANVNNLDEFNYVEQGIDENALVTDTPPPPPSRDAQGQKIMYIFDLIHAKDACKEKMAAIVASGGVMKPGQAPDQKNVQVAQFIIGAYPDNNVAFFRDKNGSPRPMIVLQHKVAEGQAGAGRLQTEWHSAMVMQSVKTSEVDTLLKCVTGQGMVGASDGEKIKKLYQATGAGAQYRAYIEWRGEIEVPDPKDASKTKWVVGKVGGKTLNAMENFPSVTLADGTVAYKPPDTDDEGREVRTVWVVTEYLPPQASSL